MLAKSNRTPAILLVVAVLGALYSLAGYLLVGSFAAAVGEPQPYARAGMLWLASGTACVALAVAMALTMRKRRHAH
ncbi:MAG TPA: hypothetical protein VFS20_10720 [Longimicrobium sp.]|nr:hypothetical protein [Longimicrobium sp.]